MDTLMIFMSTIYRHCQIYYGKRLSKLKISSGQFMFILCICDNAGLSQDNLAEKFHMNKSTIARVAAQLEKDGFIIKKNNAKDKRIYNLYPTKKSDRIYPEIMKIIKEWNKIITMNFTDNEKKTFDNLLFKMRDNVLYNENNIMED